MRPEQLAPELGVSAKHLREWLRKTYPRPASAKHKPWHLSEAQEHAARRRFEAGPRRAETREGMEQLAVHVPAPLLQKLRRSAMRHGTTLAALVRAVLAAFADSDGKAGTR
jgi:hypothetical protein